MRYGAYTKLTNGGARRGASFDPLSLSPRVYLLGDAANITLEDPGEKLGGGSSSFDTAPWAKVNVTVTENNVSDPDGGNAGALATWAGGGEQAIYQIVAIPNAAIVYYSIYAKAGTLDNFQLDDQNNGAVFDLGDVTATIVRNDPNLGDRARITDAGDGWYFCEVWFVIKTSTVPDSRLFVIHQGDTGGGDAGTLYFYDAHATVVNVSQVADLSGRDNHGAPIALETGFVATDPVFGGKGSFIFPCEGGSVNFGLAALDEAIAGQWTMAGAFYINDDGGDFGVCFDNAGAGGDLAAVGRDDDTDVAYFFAGAGQVLSAVTAIGAHTWLVEFAGDASSKLYIDGVLVATGDGGACDACPGYTLGGRSGGIFPTFGAQRSFFLFEGLLPEADRNKLHTWMLNDAGISP